MPTPPGRPRRASVAAALARSRLGVPQVLFFVLAAAAPMTVVASAVPTAYAVTGLPGVPVAYLATAAIMALFAVGYVTMSRHVVNAGSMYAYVAHALGPAAGVAAAFVAVTAYAIMQIGLYGAFGVVAAGTAAALFGVSLPWWLWALAGWALIAGLGPARVDLNGRVLGVLLVAEVGVVIAYDVVLAAHPAASTILPVTYPLHPAHLLAPGIAAILVGGIAGYVGIEATTVLAEETRDPRRTVARATYLAIAVTAILYAGSAWAMAVATGADRVVDTAARHGPDLMFALVAAHLPAAAVDAGRLLLATSLFAALLAFHNLVARYLFALGRERVLPARLGRTNRRTGAPALGSFTQTVLSAVVVIGYAVAGWDPIVHLFFWLTVTGGLGVLILMTAATVSVLVFFHRHRHRHPHQQWQQHQHPHQRPQARRLGESRWSTLVAPGLALAVLTVVLAGTLIGFGDLLGAAPGSPVRWALPGLYAAAIAAGLTWAGVLRASRPHAYAAVGYGADANVDTTRPAVPTPRPPSPPPSPPPSTTTPTPIPTRQETRP
ncbi:APC family permease [Solwaraspora sp. WMMB335]|uniref:APC family permease n=1 Tax=Solwaraspora sp. WMMB335 TaxID=3404118 RepID=UPI003B95F107